MSTPLNNPSPSPARGFAAIQVLLWFTVTASLALVSTIALSRYLDTVYFEEDLLVAAELNTIINDHPILSNEYYTAYDLRKFIMYHSGKTYDFEPKTPNTGFFYIRSQNRVIASRFSDIENIVIELRQQDRFLLSDDPEEEPLFNCPEELFGAGIILLSKSGSLVSETVSTLRSLPESPFPLDAYRRLERSLNHPLKHLINGNNDHVRLLKDLIIQFDPSTTLYANNTYWSTGANKGEDIKRILFANGISNIPAYDLGLVTDLEEIILPISVRTLEKDAMTETLSRSLKQIIITSTSTVQLLEGAVADHIDILHGNFVEITLDALTDYSDSIDFSIDDFGTFKVDFSRLEIRSSVTEYRVVRIGAKYFLYIFSDEGLIGYAEGVLSYD